MAGPLVVAEAERDALDRVGRRLAGRIGELRSTLLDLSRTSSDYLTRHTASEALHRDDAREQGVPYRAGEPDLSRIRCVRCGDRDRAPGSLWCRWCEPRRSTASAGRD